MVKKLLASDLDGTLITKDEQGNYGVSEENLKAIKAFQKAGHLFGVCTGRGFNYVNTGCEAVDFDFYIASSGAIIANQNKKIIFKSTLKRDLIKQIINTIGDEEYLFIQHGQSYVMNLKEELPIKEVSSIDEFDEDEFEGFAVVIPGEIERTSSVLALINEQFNGKINAFQNQDSIDFVAVDASKGEGVNHIAKYFNIDDIYVIGDSWNDISMFEKCQNSFTFNHSPKDVKKKAKYHVDSVATCIKKIIEM